MLHLKVLCNKDSNYRFLIQIVFIGDVLLIRRGNKMNTFKKFKERTLKGYSGLAIKNSIHQISITGITKIGSLIFTAIIARILMPELFGLYSLVFFTIFTFISFSDMGVGTALTRFVSKALSKGDMKKAKAYSSYLFKIRIILTLISFLVLIVFARFISTTYYQKPIFLALLVGAVFVVILSMIGFIENVFRSSNQFQGITLKESFFQIARVLISPILIIILLKYSLTQEVSMMMIMAAIFIPYALTLIFFTFLAKKKITFLKSSVGSLKTNEKKGIRRFMYPLSISLIFYTILDQTDIILLGKFVTSEFIGYYSAAFFLISPATALTALSVALFPIFSRLEGEQLKRGLKKSLKIIFLISFSFTVLIVVFAPLMVGIVYGNEYSTSINLLRLGSLVIVPCSMIGIYVNFLISKGKTKLTAKILIFLTVVKLVLAYTLISTFIKISLLAGTVGIISARVITEYIYLGILIFFCSRSK
jgi:O-antigen/teichoic acid export membrane protein